MPDPNQAPAIAEAQPGFSVMERIRNSRLGMMMTAAAASLTMFGAAESGALALADQPASTPTEQDCITAGLVRPETQNLAMHHAGILPLNRQHLPSQYTWGRYDYSAMPDGCSPEYLRITKGTLEMQKYTNPKVWIHFGGPDNPWHAGDQAGSSTLLYAPPHTKPSYIFDECRDGKFLKARDIVEMLVKDTSTPDNQVVGQQTYTFPIPVHGNCEAAAHSSL